MPDQFYQALGGQGIGTSFPAPVQSTRNPASTDQVSPNGYPYPFGQEWVNTTSGEIFVYAGRGNWETATSGQINVTNVAGNYTALSTDYYIGVDTAGGAYTITLPLNPVVGQAYDIVDSTGHAGANNITISGNGHNINGAATTTISTNYGALSLVYNGTQWTNGAININSPLGVAGGGTGDTTLTANGVLYGSTAAPVGVTAAGGAATVLVGGTPPSFSATPTVTSITTTGGATIIGTTVINNSGAANTTIGTGGTGIVAIGNVTGNTAVTGTLTASAGLIATTGGITAAAGGAAITGTTTINITGAATTTIGTGGTGIVAIGNVTGNTAVTGTLTASAGLVATTGGLTVSAGGAAITGTTTINTAGAAATSIGNASAVLTETASSIVLAPAGGTISITPATVSGATATQILNARLGQATFTGFTTAAAATQVFTITNSLVSATNALKVSASNQGSNDAQMTITRVNQGAGTFDVSLKNNGAAALNGNVLITFWVLN